jgi:transposase
MRLAVRGASRQVAFEVARLAWACGCSLENGTGEHARLPVLAHRVGWRSAAAGLDSGAEQKSSAPMRTAAFAPGCVKTLLVCYDSLVILRGKLMRRFVEQAVRGQSTLLPECLDDFIDDSNPVRVIDVFVEALDLAEMSFEGVEPAATGRPSYHPSILLKLYICEYLNRVQSSRRLEREAGRNVEVMWLLGRLAPDHKTIADFRKDNGLGLRKVCARFVELCREMGLLATASVAIDGSKFKAVNKPGQELHTSEGGAAASPAGGELCAIPEPARHGRPTGADRSAGHEGDKAKGETDKAEGANGQACRLRKADAGFARPADILDRSRQSTNGDERSRVRLRRLQRAGRRRYRTSSDCCARSHEQRLRPGATGLYG